MKKFVLVILSCGLVCSCSQNFLLDEQARQDLRVCTGAAFISSSIRGDETNLAIYQKASDVIGSIIKDEPASRVELECRLNEALGKLFSQMIVDIVVSEILEVYDENIQSIHDNKKLLLSLESTKSSIDSGIQMAIKTGRPVKIVPKS